MPTIRSSALPRAAGLLVLSALAACANPRADEALFAQTALIGMPRQTLLSCAGVPERTATVDNLEYFTYRSARVVSFPSTAFSFVGTRYAGDVGVAVGIPLYAQDVRSYSCEATFTLRNGRVERIVYTGDDSSGGARLAQCYNIVENCLQILPGEAPASMPAPE